MIRLLTKAQKEDARKSWINGRKTEVYKDIEILTTDNKNNNGIIQYYITIWKSRAGHPYLNNWCRFEDQRDRIIQEEKTKADKREGWKKQNSTNGKVLSGSAKTAVLIRSILKRDYPGIKFSIRSENFANGDSVNVSWTDGIPAKDLKSFLYQFQYGNFDGMTDSYNHDNVKDMPQAKFVFGARSISKEKYNIIREQLAQLMGIPDDDQSEIPNDFMVNVRGYSFKAQLSALIYQITIDYDFTKGFIGVRNKKTEAGETITNLFEIY